MMSDTNGYVPALPSDDPRLDRRIQFDKRSRLFNVGETPLVERRIRPYTWLSATQPRLDQGNEGACVGFGWGAELASRPRAIQGVNDSIANLFYHEAQQIDEWEGDDYEGTSVLAGAKVIQRRGFMNEYRWAFNLKDLLVALGNGGPVVMGTWWWSGMFEPGSDGFVHPTGYRAGGHCWTLYGTASGKPGRMFVRAINSWGPSWGMNGSFLVSWDDLEFLLHDEGEACIPMGRQPGVIN